MIIRFPQRGNKIDKNIAEIILHFLKLFTFVSYV